MSEPVMVGGAPTAAGNRRIFILLGVAVALALVALVLPKVLFGGGEEAAEEPATPAPVTTPADAVPAGGAATEEPVAEPVRTFEVFSTKNPFTPLIDMTPDAAVAPVAGEAAPPAGVAPVPGTETPSAVPSGGTATEPSVGQRVALLEVYVDDAGVTIGSVRVNDTVHEVAEGATFATRYKAVTLSVADGCGQFLYGDASFRLCEGEELLK